MKEYSLWVFFLIGTLLLFFRGLEKLKFLGGDKEKEFPNEDGFFWFTFIFCQLFIYVIVRQVIFLIDLTASDPGMLIIYSNQFFGLAILSFLTLVLLIKGLINPSLNFILSLISCVIISIIFWDLNILRYSMYTSPIVGILGGIVIHVVLRSLNKNGNKQSWEIPQVWRKVNNKYFLLIFSVIFLVETMLQIQLMSITTFWLYI